MAHRLSPRSDRPWCCVLRGLLVLGWMGLFPADATAEKTDGLQAERAADPQAWTLRYDVPAAEWVEALPVGNGRLGAMVFGGPEQERIQFNDDTLWTGRPHDYTHPGGATPAHHSPAPLGWQTARGRDAGPAAFHERAIAADAVSAVR